MPVVEHLDLIHAATLAGIVTPAWTMPTSGLAAEWPRALSTSVWQRQQQGFMIRSDQRRKVDLQAEQQRIFGGEAGDEVSLCGPMLQVLLSLFGGLDYTDP
ncbi:MAG: hypothetical protein M1817_001027 [Caeruleum heppii]|nr:MAG: hypothetical protein M1817_001027 [Caeruleum heppii]